MKDARWETRQNASILILSFQTACHFVKMALLFVFPQSLHLFLLGKQNLLLSTAPAIAVRTNVRWLAIETCALAVGVSADLGTSRWDWYLLTS